MKTVSKMEKAFARYVTLKERSELLIRYRPGGAFGIAVKDDIHAKAWQKLQFRLHFFECYLRGQRINWFHAKWLSNEEAFRRNEQGAEK